MIIKLWVAMGWFFVLLTSPLSAKEPAEKFHEVIASPALLQNLKHGGYVVYMRHGKTDNSRPDRVPKVDLNDCATQRVLNETGKQVAKRVGDYLRQAGISIGEVYASPMCRAKDSAQYAFHHYRLEQGIMYTGGMTSAEKKPVLQKTKSLISMPVAKGENRFLVAHAPNMMDLMGYFPEESTLVIFKPLGKMHYQYLGSIRPQDWPNLLKQK